MKNTLLELPLDEMIDGKLIDIVKGTQAPVIEGAPKIIPDDQFGSCLSLDGEKDGLIINDPLVHHQGDFSMTLWFFLPSDQKGSYQLVGKNTNGYLKPAIWVVNNELHYRMPGADGSPYEGKLTEMVKPGKWQHLAWVKQGTQMSFFINTEMAGSFPAPAQLAVDKTLQWPISELTQPYRGKLAYLCFFDGALSAAEVQQHMAKTQNATSTFKQEYPIRFHFEDDGNRNTFYISDAAIDNQCHCVLENIADQRLIIKPGTEKPGQDHYHFQLKFKPQTFYGEQDKSSLQAIDLPAGWQASPLTLNPYTGQASLFLLYTGDKELTLEMNEQLTFPLQYDTADGSGGARGTQVELLYQQLAFPDETVLAGSNIISTEIINQRGKQQIPLQVAIVGPNKVLNNANADVASHQSSSTIRIRIANNLAPDVLKPGRNHIRFQTNQLNTTRNTQFTLLFDDPIGKVWDLALKNELKAIQARYLFQKKGQPANDVWIALKDESGAQAMSPVFSFNAPVPDMGPGDYFEIELNNIRTHSESGLSNLYLKYEDVPGYWDGQFALQIEKSPLIYKGGKVGIGTSDPIYDLEVHGSVQMGGFNQQEGSQWPQVTWLRDPHNLSKWDEGLMKADKNITPFRRGGFGIHMHESREFGFLSTNWNPLFSIAGGTGDTYVKGKVGIGTNDPKQTLEVNGGVHMGGFTQQEGSQWPNITWLRDPNNLSKWDEGLMKVDKNITPFRKGGFAIHMHESREFGFFSTGWRPLASIQGGTGNMHLRGNLSIGTTRTTKATVEIAAYSLSPIRSYGYLTKAGKTANYNNSGMVNARYSLFASERIACVEFNAHSDARIKTIEGQSDHQSDLETLSKIEITNYQYKDPVLHGNKAQKKVIGQQIAEVYPQAVSTNTSVVPDIMQPTEVKDGWVACKTNLQSGERVKILFEEGEDTIFEILEVTDSGFRITTDQSGKVLVYGREVEDFHVVDYDALSMLNISATQQLQKIIDKQQEVIDKQQAMIEGLTKRLEALEQ